MAIVSFRTCVYNIWEFDLFGNSSNKIIVLSFPNTWTILLDP